MFGIINMIIIVVIMLSIFTISSSRVVAICVGTPIRMVNNGGWRIMILIVMICRFCLCLIIFGRRVLILVVNLNVTVIMITQVILFLNGILDMVSVMFLMVIVIIHVRITVIARGLNRLTIFLLFYRCYYCGYYYDPYYPRDKP